MFPLPSSPLQQLFDQATQSVLNDQWQTFYCAQHWWDILPSPDLSGLPTGTGRSSLSPMYANLPTLREHELRWQNLAMEFFNRHKQKISDSLGAMERHLTNELRTWNSHHPEKNEQLTIEDMYPAWVASFAHLSLKEFSGMYFGPKTPYQFLAPKYEELKKRYGMAIQNSPTSTLRKPEELSQRQVALLFHYQNKTINRGKEADEIAKLHGHTSGEALYKKYCALSQTSDRTGVEGEGRIKPMIKDITKIIPYLEGSQKQQAEDERKTLASKIQDPS